SVFDNNRCVCVGEFSAAGQRRLGVPGLPWPGGDFFLLHEAPLDGSATPETEEVTNSRTHVDTGVMVAVGARRLLAKNILEMINLEGSHILPLRIAYAALVMNGNPAALANGNTISAISLPEPGD